MAVPASLILADDATASGTADTAADIVPLRPLDPKIMELLELFTYTQQKINDHLEKAFAADNLSLAHYRALFFILRYPGITVGGLIDKLDITKQSLARVLADLIRGKRGGEPILDEEQMDLTREGYVYARVDSNDRRARQLFLTDKGSELMHWALAPVSEAMRRSFGTIGHQFISQENKE